MFLVALTRAVPKRQRAKHRSCRCPREKLSPPSDTFAPNPPAMVTTSFRWHMSNVSHNLASLIADVGSKLSLQSPTHKVNGRT